jgi:REP element-mobilizing transposase RayT
MRMAPRVYNLRSRRSLYALQPALCCGSDRFGVRVVQLSMQGNHLHLLVEAPDQIALSRAMKGLAVRLARALNKMMGTAGRVLGERYHARRLTSPTQVRSVMHYIRYNHRHHGLSQAVVDEYSSDGRFAGLLPAATLWVLTVGWRRGRVRDV